MKDFRKQDVTIEAISLVCFVPSGSGKPVHSNRPNHGLVFYTGGKSCFQLGGKKLFAGSGDIIFLPKHSHYLVQTLQREEGAGCYAINFDISEQVPFDPFVVGTKNKAHFFNLFRQSEIAWRMKKPSYQMECKGNLYHILCAMKNEFESGYLPTSTAGAIEPALEKIHEKYALDTISIAELSALCGMSEAYFRRIFKKAKGISPLRYINDLRIFRAKELILSHLYSVSEAAELSGFHDEAYFSREFKKATGLSPSEYAKTKNGI